MVNAAKEAARRKNTSADVELMEMMDMCCSEKLRNDVKKKLQFMNIKSTRYIIGDKGISDKVFYGKSQPRREPRKSFMSQCNIPSELQEIKQCEKIRNVIFARNGIRGVLYIDVKAYVELYKSFMVYDARYYKNRQAYYANKENSSSENDPMDNFDYLNYIDYDKVSFHIYDSQKKVNFDRQISYIKLNKPYFVDNIVYNSRLRPNILELHVNGIRNCERCSKSMDICDEQDNNKLSRFAKPRRRRYIDNREYPKIDRGCPANVKEGYENVCRGYEFNTELCVNNEEWSVPPRLAYF